MTTKPTAKHACDICKHEFRADNLMRHVYVHRNELTSFMKPERVKYCIDNKMPVMYPDSNEWIMCVICRKSARLGGHGTSVKDFIRSYNSVHSKCRECFETVKELYLPPANTIMELETPTPPVIFDHTPPPVDSKYVVSQQIFEKLKSTFEPEEGDDELTIDDMIDVVLMRVAMRQKQINKLEKQLFELQKSEPTE